MMRLCNARYEWKSIISLKSVFSKMGHHAWFEIIGEQDCGFDGMLIQVKSTWFILGGGGTQVERGKLGTCRGKGSHFHPSGKWMSPSQTVILVNQWVIFFFHKAYFREIFKFCKKIGIGSESPRSLRTTHI